MASGTGRTTPTADGVRVARTGGLRRDVIALAVVCAGLVGAVWLLRAGAAPVAMPPASSSVPDLAPAPGSPEAPARAERTPPAPSHEPPRTRAQKLRALRAAGIRHERGPDGKPRLDAAPVIEALNAAGVRDGIGAFPPPGTDPPKEGLVVPDDFVLPEGYVRHHQSTDDGEALPPILMFHPDYEFVDEDGTAVAIPSDRIVPPELAPPGLAVKTLEIPRRPR